MSSHADYMRLGLIFKWLVMRIASRFLINAQAPRLPEALKENAPGSLLGALSSRVA